MVNQVNFFTTAPIDLLIKIFGNIPLEQRVKCFPVCKFWSETLSKDIFWGSVLEEINPKRYQTCQTDTGTPGFKAIVKTFFVDNREDIKFIVDLLKNDGQLAKCLHTDQWTLEEYKSKSAFERSYLLWRAMHHDATPVVVELLKNVLPAFFEYSSRKESQRINKNEVLKQFLNEEKFTPIAFSLMQTHQLPYNKSEVICALLTFFSIHPGAKNLILSFIKSHADLSELKDKYIETTPHTPNGGGRIPASDVLRTFMSLERMNVQDMIACKLFGEDPTMNQG